MCFEIAAVSDVIEQELGLLNAQLTRQGELASATFALDYVSINQHGRISQRAETLDAFASESSDWAGCTVLPGIVGNMIADGIVSVIYFAETATGATCRSSLWRKLSDRWQIVLHQQTAS